jgi:hypothetical protein
VTSFAPAGQFSLSSGSGSQHSSPPTRNQVVNQYYCCDYKKRVNQSAADVGDQTQQPKHNQNRDNRPKHSLFPFGVYFLRATFGSCDYTPLIAFPISLEY